MAQVRIDHQPLQEHAQQIKREAAIVSVCLTGPLPLSSANIKHIFAALASIKIHVHVIEAAVQLDMRGALN